MAGSSYFDPRIEAPKVWPRLASAGLALSLLALGWRAVEGQWPGQGGQVGSTAEARATQAGPARTSFRNDPLTAPDPLVTDGFGVVRGEVGTSLYSSMTRMGAPPAVTLQAVRLLGMHLDLTRDIARGDRIALVFSADPSSGERDSQLTGRLEMLQFESDARHLTFFQRPDAAQSEFVTAEGRSAAARFLATPVDGARISSEYGIRLHPILGYDRLHGGIDYAAATGTPVLAAADGEIVSMAAQGGYGNLVVIRHSDGLETAYAHLSGFHPLVQTGDRVEQGQPIGYVGQSGMATGPHLHFEVRRDGQAINPRNAGSLSPERLEGALLARHEFRREIFLRKVSDSELRPALARLEPQS